MKKIIQRTRGFEKSFQKLQPKTQSKFLAHLAFFLEDEFHPKLSTHQLKGSRSGEWSFSVTHDIRAIYTKHTTATKTTITFTFIDIGTHNKVY